MCINECIAPPCNTKPICITNLILLQKKALDMQNTMMQKSEFSKMQDCSRFLQIGSHILLINIVYCTTLYINASQYCPISRLSDSF